VKKLIYWEKELKFVVRRMETTDRCHVPRLTIPCSSAGRETTDVTTHVALFNNHVSCLCYDRPDSHLTLKSSRSPLVFTYQ